mmetsp:Transcript_36763/g.63860  ORF Transcript_36763/g.63860 Transcript_36763/m.63860 type:complete len:188 (-) Transcript_36763:2-565(-)
MDNAEETQSTDEKLDLPSLLKQLVQRNRHVAGMALVHQEGTGAEYEAPLSVGMDAPDEATSAALNSAFFEGEESPIVQLGGHRLTVAERKEVGELLLVRLASTDREAILPPAPAATEDVLEASDFCTADTLGTPSPATLDKSSARAGAFICPSQRWVITVLYEEGMDAEMAGKVCFGTAEYLASEGC